MLMSRIVPVNVRLPSTLNSANETSIGNSSPESRRPVSSTACHDIDGSPDSR